MFYLFTKLLNKTYILFTKRNDLFFQVKARYPLCQQMQHSIKQVVPWYLTDCCHSNLVKYKSKCWHVVPHCLLFQHFAKRQTLYQLCVRSCFKIDEITLVVDFQVLDPAATDSAILSFQESGFVIVHDIFIFLLFSTAQNNI